MVAAALESAHGWEPGFVEIRPVKTSGDRIQDRALAEVGGNRVLELLTMVLTRLTRSRMPAAPAEPDPRSTRAVVDVHQRIVDAIVAGDRDLARHRMRRHLDALVHWTN